jgi:hypothetical protein
MEATKPTRWILLAIAIMVCGVITAVVSLVPRNSGVSGAWNTAFPIENLEAGKTLPAIQPRTPELNN